MRMVRTITVLVAFLLNYNQGFAQLMCATNPSFEGPSQAHVVPAPWTNCGGSPDTQPGQWGITQAPSDGSSYVSFLQSGSGPGGYFEGASQVLSACMVAGQTYSITMDLAHSNVYNTASPANCASTFAIYGGNSICHEGELLGQVTGLTTTSWQTFSFTWVATGNWCYITFRPIWVVSCNGYINILVDNFGCVTLVGGAVTTTDVTCNGACDGTATVTPTTGTPPYTFNWSTGGTSSTITGLCPATYDVTITDATGATDAQDGTVAEPTALTAPVTAVNVSCLGGSDGSASVAAAGGTTAYTYAWSAGGSGTSVTGLAQGNYDITVTDANGCQVITPFTIADGGIVVANISATVDVSCFGGNDGSATVSVTDGVPAYTYLWCNGQTSVTATTLSMGACAVTITDANECTVSVTATIAEPPVLTSGISASTAVTCFGACDGTASATQTGGTPPYTYMWGDGQTTQVATGLCVGATSLDIRDAKNCLSSTSVTIAEPPVLALTTTFINPGCMDSCDGSATVSATGGIPPYTYGWNDPSAQTTTTAIGLCDGAYVITVQDSNGCVAVATAVLVDPPPFIATIASVTNVDCFGNCNGVALVTVSGGGLPYTYLWSSGDTSDQTMALCAGNYDVTVYNINGCRSIASTPITQPPVLDVTNAGVNASCFGACNGSITATPTGGAPPYTYLWDDPIFQTTATAINLCSAPGGTTYTVLVTDTNGCTFSQSTIITQPTVLGLNQSIVQPTTCSSNNGGACVNGTGGVTPYTYLWNDSSTTADSCLTGVFAGAFDVSVTDAMGCVFNVPVLITDIAGPIIDSITAPALMCFEDSNGTASGTFSGGTSSFTYTWFDGSGAVIATGSTVIFNLTADNYTWEIKDGNQCIAADTFSITEPPFLASAIFPYADATCSGTCNGSATVNVNGGTPAYTYNWTTTGGTNTSDSGLCAGTHNVFIIDANGCTTQSSQIISEPLPLTASSLPQDVSCNGGADGSIYMTPSGGTIPYTYNWIVGGQTASFIIGQIAGTYTVDITDALGCQITEVIVIAEPPLLQASSATISSTCGDANGSAIVIPVGGTMPWNYVWNPGGFQTTDTAVALLAGTYAVTVTDAKNCIDTLNGIVVSDIPGPVIDSITVQDVDCNGNSTGSGTAYLTPGVGTPTFTYSWSNGTTATSTTSTNTATSFAAGADTLIVTDANGCIIKGTFTVNEPVALSALIIPISQICYGQSGFLDATGSIGGVPPYAFAWDNSIATDTQTVSPLATTTYMLTVTDANGCPSHADIEVLVGPQISLSLPPVTICEDESTDLTVSTSGGLGSGNYSYSWDPSVSSTKFAPNLTPSLPGATYNVTVTDGCSNEETISVFVTVDPKPVARFTFGCFPDPFLVQFDASNSGIASGTIVSYAWNFGDTASGSDNSSTQISEEHDFTPGNGSPFFNVSLTVVSDLGCTDDTVGFITPPPVADFIVDPLEASSLNPLFDLINTSSFLDPSSVFEWSFGDGVQAPLGNGAISGIDNTSGTYLELSHSYIDTGIFYITLTVEEPNGCKDSTGQYIRIKAEYIMFTPNTFMPGSIIEENRIFRPKIIGMGDDEFEIYIYDRWGDKVYDFIGNYNTWIGWDGIANDGKQMAQSDVYVWLIRTEDLNQDAHEYIGHITLLR